jgi:hypothetical protein
MAPTTKSPSLNSGRDEILSFDTPLVRCRLSIRDDDDQHILGETNDSLCRVAGECRRPSPSGEDASERSA